MSASHASAERVPRPGLMSKRSGASGRPSTLDIGRATAEAVQHPPLRYAFRRQDGERVVPGVAGVHDERELARARETDLLGEHLTLHGPGRVVVVIVQAALTDGHHFWLRR